MPFNYYVATLTFVLFAFLILVTGAYKFAVLELKKERLALSREVFENMIANDDDDEDEQLASIFSRPAPDPSIIGTH